MIQPPTPFEGAYWVVPGSFLAGPFPGALDSRSLMRRVRAILDLGILDFVSLIVPEEHYRAGFCFPPYQPFLEELALSAGLEARVRNFPISDFGITTPARMSAVLDCLDRTLEEDRKVYLHCWGGRGRTGTVVGCWLRRHGLAGPDEVLARVEALRSGGYGMLGQAPETGEQRKMVREWPRNG